MEQYLSSLYNYRLTSSDENKEIIEIRSLSKVKFQLLKNFWFCFLKEEFRHIIILDLIQENFLQCYIM